MKTRIITFAVSGENEQTLNEYAEELADLVDEAMEAQEEGGNIPAGVTYDGVEVVDPDAPDAEAVEPEVVDDK